MHLTSGVHLCVGTLTNVGRTKHGAFTDKPGTLRNDAFVNPLDTRNGVANGRLRIIGIFESLPHLPQRYAALLSVKLTLRLVRPIGRDISQRLVPLQSGQARSLRLRPAGTYVPTVRTA